MAIERNIRDIRDITISDIYNLPPDKYRSHHPIQPQHRLRSAQHILWKSPFFRSGKKEAGVNLWPQEILKAGNQSADILLAIKLQLSSSGPGPFNFWFIYVKFIPSIPNQIQTT